MSDKLNILTSNIIRFVAGERPTADKFNAMNLYYSRSIENICRVIGDVYGRSISDPLSPKWNPHSNEDGRSLDIATLGRLIGPASNLNPKMIDKITSIEESFDADFINSNKEINLKYASMSSLIGIKTIDGSGNESNIFTSNNEPAWSDESVYEWRGDDGVFSTNSYRTIYLHPNLTLNAGETLTISYNTYSLNVEGGINYYNSSWNVIPDPNQNEKIKFDSSESVNGGGVLSVAGLDSEWDYKINLNNYFITSQQSGATNLQESVIQGLKYEYNENEEYSLPKWYEEHFVDSENAGNIVSLPEGLLYLKDLTSNEIYLTASYGYLNSKEIYIKDASLCEDHDFCLILTGTDITTSIDDLRNKMFNHRHDGSFGEPFIRIQDLVGKFVTGEFGPSSIPGNEFPMYLHRKGYQTDTNVLNGNNAMLGDILLGNILFNGISNTDIEGDNLELTSSHKVYFLNKNNYIQKLLGKFTITNNDDRLDGVTNQTVINTGHTLNLIQKYWNSTTSESVNFDTGQTVNFNQHNININTTANNTQNQSRLDLNSGRHHEDFEIKEKVNYSEFSGNDDLSLLNEQNSRYFLSEQHIYRRTDTTSKIVGLDNNYNDLNIGDRTNSHKTRKLKTIRDVREKQKHFKIVFKPSQSIRYEVYPKPYYYDINISENGFNDSASILKEYGTAFAAIDVYESNQNGDYIQVYENIDVNYEKDPTGDRRRISHYLPIIENSFEFNFKKAFKYENNLIDINGNDVPEYDYGVWKKAELDFPGNQFGDWALSNKESQDRMIYFNSDLPISSRAYSDTEAVWYFKDTNRGDAFTGPWNSIKLHMNRNDFRIPYTYRTGEIGETYLTKQFWLPHPDDDKYKSIRNMIDIAYLLKQAYVDNTSNDVPNIALNDASLKFSLNVSYIPSWGDDELDSRLGIDQRWYYRFFAKSWGLKVVFKDSLNEMGQGANKMFYGWLLGGTDSDQYNCDYQWEHSDKKFFPDEEGDDPDGDGYVTFWAVLKVEADINRFFLRETDVDTASPKSSTLWARIERGDLNIYLTWLPKDNTIVGHPIDTMAVGRLNMDWDDPGGADDSMKKEYSIGITYDGYDDKSRVICTAVQNATTGYDSIMLNPYSGDNKLSGHTAVYRSNHLGINVHYLFFPRILDGLDINEERYFSFNSIDTELSLIRRNSITANEFLLEDHRDDGFYIAKYSYGYVKFGTNTHQDYYSGWAEMPNIIFSYGDKNNSINYDLSESWYREPSWYKNRETHTSGSTSNLKKDFRINGKHVLTTFVDHVDISDLIKQYFVIFELKTYIDSRVIPFRSLYWDEYQRDYEEIVEPRYLDYPEYGGVFFKEPYHWLFGRNESSDELGQESDSQSAYHRNFGINFNLEVKEKKLSSNDLIIDMNIVFSIEMLPRYPLS